MVRGALSSRGFTDGSPSKTSRPAAKMVPDSRASTSASSSTTGPRAVLIEDGCRLHPGELRRADEMAGRLGERDVQAHDVRSCRAASSSVGTKPRQSGVVSCGVDDVHVEAARPVGRRLGRCVRIRPVPASVPCTSRARWVPNPQPVHRPSRRSLSASDAKRVAVRIRRKARSAVVSSSTPGVLHTVMPSAVRRDDVDVVVPDCGIRHHPQPSRSPDLEHGCVHAIGEVADDPVALCREARSARPATGERRRPRSTISWPASSRGSVPPSVSGRVTRTRAT